MASRSFGSNHVLLGGMMPPASAIVIRSRMLVGYIENAQAYSPEFTSFSNSPVPRMPPTKFIRLLVLGSSIPNMGASTYFWRRVTSKFFDGIGCGGEMRAKVATCAIGPQCKDQAHVCGLVSPFREF